MTEETALIYHWSVSILDYLIHIFGGQRCSKTGACAKCCPSSPSISACILDHQTSIWEKPLSGFLLTLDSAEEIQNQNVSLSFFGALFPCQVWNKYCRFVQIPTLKWVLCCDNLLLWPIFDRSSLVVPPISPRTKANECIMVDIGQSSLAISSLRHITIDEAAKWLWQTYGETTVYMYRSVVEGK